MNAEPVFDKAEKERIAREILSALPDWFGIPESTAAYIAACEALPFWACFEGGKALGFLALKETGPRTAELHVMGSCRTATAGGSARLSGPPQRPGRRSRAIATPR